MKNRPKVYSGVTFKILSVSIPEDEYIRFVNQQINFIAMDIANTLNKEVMKYKEYNLKKLLKNRLIKFIEKYNFNKSNPFYLWLDEEFIVSEFDLYDRDLTMGYDEDEDQLLDVVLNIRDELYERNDYKIDPESHYHIFSICIFFKNTPISVVKF